MLYLSEKAKVKWLFITVIDRYGNEFDRKHRKKLKSRWLFSPVIGDYSSKYSETTHGAPGVFITVITITVMNVPIVIGIWHLVHSIP